MRLSWDTQQGAFHTSRMVSLVSYLVGTLPAGYYVNKRCVCGIVAQSVATTIVLSLHHIS